MITSVSMIPLLLEAMFITTDSVCGRVGIIKGEEGGIKKGRNECMHVS